MRINNHIPKTKIMNKTKYFHRKDKSKKTRNLLIKAAQIKASRIK